MEDPATASLDPVNSLLEQAEALQFLTEAIELKASQLEPPLSTFLRGLKITLLMHEDAIHQAVDAIEHQGRLRSSQPFEMPEPDSAVS